MGEKEEYDDHKALSLARELSAEMRMNLPRGYSIASISTKSKLPFKALALREAIIHRVSELADTSCQLFEQKKYISAFILTRSLMETVGFLFWVFAKVTQANRTKNIGNIDDFFMRVLFGCRDDAKRRPAYNVLNAIDKIDESFEGYRKMYDDLSEFAHPNWSGLAGSYSELDGKKYTITFGLRTEDIPLSIGLAPLAASLHIFKHYYNELGNMIPTFIRVCDSAADARKT